MYQNIHIEPIDRNTNSHKVFIWDDVDGLVVDDFKPYAFKPKRNGEYKSLHGVALEKTYNFSYKKPGYYETDVPITTRILIDKYGNSSDMSTGNRVGCIDIETGTDGGFAKPDKPFQPITAIAYHDDLTNVYYSFILDVNGINVDYDDNSIIKLKLNKNEVEVVYNKRIRFFKTESELVLTFFDLYEKLQPTILTGWHTDGFDMPYIYHRVMQILGESVVSRLSPIGVVKYLTKKEKLYIAGVSQMDYLPLYKKMTFATKRLPNHQLNTVAIEELGMEKLKYEGSLSQLLRTDIKKFVEYNLNDVLLVVLIERVNKFIDLARGLSHVGHICYEDYSVSSRIIEGALLTHLHSQNIIACDKPDVEEGGELIDGDDDSDVGFEGAYVKEPEPGLYEWVFSVDINSLYPSIIMSLNISPETKVAKIENWNLYDRVSGKMKSVTVIPVNGDAITFSSEEFDAFIKKNKLSISSAGILYSLETDGLLKTILVKWYAERRAYKDKMIECADNGDKDGQAFYKLRQGVQKILLNSLYGVLGLKSGRFYDLDNAESTTLSGQDIIKSSEKYLNSLIKNSLGDRYEIEYDDGSFEYIYENDREYSRITQEHHINN